MARPVDRDIKERLETVVASAGQVVLGKERQIRLALACLLARGHLLIEDLPGVGKTTLAHVLARALGLQFNRIQFTSDMLPADILGVAIFNRQEGAFVFHAGPIFAHVILADEVNRATPKTQSALLEAMEEQQVTVEGETRPLPNPFFVIATQNPAYQVGTFPLPESQLDRFMMRIHLGYPGREAERELLRGRERRELIQDIAPCMGPEELAAVQRQVPEVFVSEALLDYLQALLAYSRESPDYPTGLSPRAGLSLLRAAQAWALLAGRDSVLPDDLQTVLPGVVAHRLVPPGESGQAAAERVTGLISAVPIP
jgi:MoxR-like ATPase